MAVQQEHVHQWLCLLVRREEPGAPEREPLSGRVVKSAPGLLSDSKRGPHAVFSFRSTLSADQLRFVVLVPNDIDAPGRICGDVEVGHDCREPRTDLDCGKFDGPERGWQFLACAVREPISGVVVGNLPEPPPCPTVTATRAFEHFKIAFAGADIHSTPIPRVLRDYLRQRVECTGREQFNDPDTRDRDVLVLGDKQVM
jgi:hypothetical protein